VEERRFVGQQIVVESRPEPVARHDVLDDAHLARLVVVHDGRVAGSCSAREQDGAAEQEPADARLAEKTSHHGSEHLHDCAMACARRRLFTG
jgi:hypothetical protein